MTLRIAHERLRGKIYLQGRVRLGGMCAHGKPELAQALHSAPACTVLAISRKRRILVQFRGFSIVNKLTGADAMTDITNFSTARALPEAPHMIGADRWLTRGAQRLFGATLILAAAGLWMSQELDPDLALFKLGVSVFIGFAGLSMFQAGRAQPTVEIEIDTVRREVRLVRGKGRARTLVSRSAIADLGPAEVNGTMARLWTSDGQLVAEVAMSDPDLRRSLIGALRDAGKL